MKSTPFFIALFLMCINLSSAYSQVVEELLKTATDANQDIETRLESYMDLAKIYMRSDAKEYLKYAKSLNQLSKDSERLDFQAKSYGMMANAMIHLQEYDKAREYFNKSIHICRTENLLDVSIVTYSNLAILETELGNFDEAIRLYNEALELLKKSNSKENYDSIYHGIGAVYMQLGKFESAIEYYLKSLEFLSDEHKEMAGTVKASISGCYLGLKSYDLSLEYAQEAEKIAREFNLHSLSVALNNKAQAYLDLGFFREAELTFLEIINLNENKQDLYAQAYAYHGLGKTYFKLDDYDLALEYYTKALELEEQFNLKLELVSSYGAIGQVQMKKGEYHLAKKYLEKSEKIAEEIGAKDDLIIVKFLLIENKLLIRNLDEIAETLKLNLALKDSIYDKGVIRAVSDMEAKYKRSEQDKKIVEQELRLANQNRQLISQRLNYSYALGIIGVLVLFGINTTLNARRRKKHNAVLSSRNNEIEQQNSELIKLNNQISILNQDIEHRTSNHLEMMMTLIKMDVRSSQDGMTQIALINNQNRLQAVSSIHAQLQISKNKRRISFDKYLTSLCSYLEDFYISKYDNFKIALDVEKNIYIDALHATNLAIIVNELVTNSVKYAFEGNDNPEIQIRLAKNEKGVLLSLRDNGIGVETEKFSDKGTGIHLVEELVASINGDLSIQNNNGLEYTIWYYTNIYDYASN